LGQQLVLEPLVLHRCVRLEPILVSIHSLSMSCKLMRILNRKMLNRSKLAS
jgi:hypothetical protein